MIPGIRQQELKTQVLPTNVPYVFEDLGVAKLLNFYHKSYFYINITQLRLTITQANGNINILRAPSTEAPGTNSQIFHQLENKLESLKNKLSFLIPTRHKRGLVNGLGSIIKLISGNLDENDLQMIMDNMNKLRENQNLLDSQNSKTLSIVRNITEKFETNLKIINENFNKTYTLMKQVYTFRNTYLYLFQEYIHLQTLEDFLDEILHSILLSSQKGANFFLLNPPELCVLEQHLKNIFSPEELIPFPSLTTIETLSLFKLSNIITENEIIFVLEIPIVQKETFRYKNVFPLVFNDRQLLILPETHILKAKKDFFVKDCMKAKNFHLCSDIMTNSCDLETLQDCIIVSVKNFSRISIMSNESLIVTSDSDIEIYDTCVNEKFQIPPNTIISQYCNLEIKGLYYHSKITHHNIAIPQIKRTTNIVSDIQLEKVQSLDEIKHSIDKNNIHLKLKDLYWHNVSNSIVTVIIVVISCILVLYFVQRKCIEKKGSKKDEDLHSEEMKNLHPGLQLSQLST